MHTCTRRLLGTLLFALASLFTTASQATLTGTTPEGGVLTFDPAAGPTVGFAPASGSWFAVYTGASGDGYNYQPMESLEGIYVDAGAQPASGSHSGDPDGSESPSIDVPTSFFANTSFFGTVSNVAILSASGNTASLDFTGLLWYWAGVEGIPLTDNANFSDTGIASVVCANDCSPGDDYVLDFMGHIPLGDPSGLGGISVQMHLEGLISTPIPAAAWLFGSGLLGLLGVARRKR